MMGVQYASALNFGKTHYNPTGGLASRQEYWKERSAAGDSVCACPVGYGPGPMDHAP